MWFSGKDKISFTDLRASDLSASLTLAGAAATAIDTAYTSNNTNFDSRGDVVLFNYNSKTYAVINAADATTTFVDGTDILLLHR